jgi:hypothetical protein
MKKYSLLSFRTLFFLLPVLYFFLYGPYGLDDVDGGYTMGYVYRILSGQVPYRDFILVRPPLSIYLHCIPAFIFPSSHLLILERFIIYLNFAATALVSVWIIRQHFDLKKYQLDSYLLASIIFVFSVHNYPPMALHTTDGILLGVMGIYFLSSKNSVTGIFFGMLFLVSSALTKQSFYPMPLAGLLYLFLTKSSRSVITGVLSLFVLAGGIYLLASAYHLIQPFVFWTNGSTHLKDFLEAGVFQYFKVTIKHIKSIFILLASFFVLKIISKRFFKVNLEYGWLLVFYSAKTFIQVLLNSYYFHGNFIKTENPYSHPQLFFLISGAGILWIIFKERKKDTALITLCFLLALSWCSSLSWGYATPILFSAPLMFGVIWINSEFFHFSRPRLLYYFLLTGGLVCFGFAYYYCPMRIAIIPNYDSTRKDFTYDMGTVFPKLSSIRSDQNTFSKYTELKTLASKYGDHFKTLPTILLANYLTDTQSPINIDWPMDREINFNGDSIIYQLNKSNCYVFVDTVQIARMNTVNYGWGSLATLYVMSHWKKIEDTHYFQVYHQSDQFEKKEVR